MLARRSVLRVARSPVSRRFASTAAEGSTKYVQDIEALEGHARHTSELWRKISNYFFLPAIAVGGIWAYQLEEEHHAHLEHVIEENGGTYPFPPAYEYMNLRVRPFPWGQNNLFFNPVVNKNLQEEQ